MIRISGFPRCWIEEISSGKMPFFDWLEASAELDCEGLEIYWSFLESHASNYLADVRRRIERHGRRMSMMCFSPDFTLPDEGLRAEQVELQKKMIRVTAELGGKFCRTLSGQRRPEVSAKEGLDWVVACIESCLPVAEQCGVTLAIENHYKDGAWEYPEFAQKKDMYMSILNRIDSPLLGVQYDPSNALVAGHDPIKFLDEVLPRIVTMHASDRYLLPGTSLEDMRQADGTLGYPEGLIHGVTGKGMNDYDAIFTRLARAGFNGWISIEDGMNGMDEMKESINVLKRMRDKYYGEGV